jgi:hypothetical protein
VIEVGSGRTSTFGREVGGFQDLAILRGTSSIGDALAGSSSSVGVIEGSPEKEDQHRSTPVLISTDQAKSMTGSQRAVRVNRNPVAAVIPHMEEDQPARIISARAKAEDVARQQGARRLEQQEAEQRAAANATAALGRGFAVAVSTILKILSSETRISIIPHSRNYECIPRATSLASLSKVETSSLAAETKVVSSNRHLM